jgi:hypothetical protein
MKKTIDFIIDLVGKTCLCVIGAFIVALFLACMMTPDKTKDGQYTNFYQYWTSEEYYQNNF